MPFWQNHFELALWPLALLGALWPHSIQLLWWQDVAIVATEVITLRWISGILAERLGPGRTVVELVAALGLASSLWWYETASFDVHLETLGLPFVVATGYSLWRGSKRSSIAVAAVGIFFGDVVTVSIGAIAVAALLSRHARTRGSSRVANVIAISSAVWFAIIVALDANQGSGLASNYGYLVHASPTASALSVLAALPAHLGAAAAVLRSRIDGIVRVLVTGGLLGVVSPWGGLISLATLIPTALNQNPGFLAPTAAFQTLAVIPFVFVGTVEVTTSLGRRVAKFLDTVVLGDRGTFAPPPWHSAEHESSQFDAQAPTETDARWDPGRIRPSWHSVRPWIAPTIVTAVLICFVAVAGVVNWPFMRTIPASWWQVDGAAASLLTRFDTIPSSTEVIADQGVIGRFADRQGLYPIVTAPETFPVVARHVVFVFVEGQGIELVSTSVTAHQEAYVIRTLHGRVIGAGAGVTLVAWTPPRSVATVELP